MLNTTLCYVTRGSQVLMLHRVKKKADINKDKWIGIGGKFENEESPDECLLREAKEETGLTLTSWQCRGVVTFLNDTCEGVNVLNELDVPVLCMGLKNVVVSASPEGILVSDKEQSSYIKPYVDSIHQQIMFAEKSWGSFRVLDIEDESMTIKITLNPGHGMNYHSHENRDEVWTIISGTGHAVLDGETKPVKAGDILSMKAGCKHTIFADTELKIIEVQLGKAISVEDKQKYPLPQA